MKHLSTISTLLRGTLLFFAVFATLQLFAQDLIILKNGNTLEAKVQEIQTAEIKYKRFDNLNGPVYSMTKQAVFLIKYENGTKDNFSEVLEETDREEAARQTPQPQSSIAFRKQPDDLYYTPTPTAAIPKQSVDVATHEEAKYQQRKQKVGLVIMDEVMAQQGKKDAERYYKGYKGASMLTLTTTGLGGGLLGLIPAIACSSATPKDHKLGYPDTNLMKDTSYRDGYIKQAKKIKSRHVWHGFLRGLCIAVSAAVAVSVSK